MGRSSRTSTAGVNEQNFAALFNRRLVRVAGNYGGEARRGRIEIEFREVVKNVDRVAADLDNVVGRKAARPRTLVIIAADRADRREGS
jgi:hypothetical protein